MRAARRGVNRATGTSAARGRTRPGARSLALTALAVLLLLAGAVGLIGSWTARGSADPPGTATDLAGNTVTLDPSETPIPIEQSHASADIGQALVVPSVGLDVPLGALDEVRGEITPPGFTSAYWVRNLGVPVGSGASGTVLVVMHSLRHGGLAPGNYLIDVAAQRSKVPLGASVTVAGSTYTVTGSALYPKSTIASDAALWAATPGRLLLITCLPQTGGGAAVDNLVITATRSD